MALMTKLVETKPYSFEEEIEILVWVDVMVEEYESIVKNSVWEVVPMTSRQISCGFEMDLQVKACNR